MQLEEADVLVVNKIDLLSAQQLKEVKQLITNQYPYKEILYQNSLEKKDIQQWLNSLNSLQPQKQRRSLDINYDNYGAGEAELAWFDAEVEICDKSAAGVGAILINRIYKKINDLKLPIGHLKFLLNDGKQQSKISFTSMVRVIATTHPKYGRQLS
jgi:hypothetical protein